VAANYGGRWDICQAAQQLAQKVKDGELQPSDITEESLSEKMWLHEYPEPDLCIRTSGEQRISNFMLWQFAYSELVFSDALWPDFNETHFWSAINEYNSRTRRFGRTDEQLKEEQQRA